jgi:hypothetical protein
MMQTIIRTAKSAHDLSWDLYPPLLRFSQRISLCDGAFLMSQESTYHLFCSS